MIFLFLLLLFGVGEAWGIDYALSIAGGLDPAGNTENGQLVYETPIFENTVGIDQISYTYNVYHGSGSEWMIVEYSLDGTNYESWNTKPYANNGEVVDAIPTNHPARNAIRFRFRAGGGNCWRTLWSLNIRKTTYTATITKRSNSDSDWSRIQNSGQSTAYITWKGTDTGQHVTFKLNGGTFDYYTTFLTKSYYYFRSSNDQTHTISWVVDDGYTISVTDVSLMVRASLNQAEVKVGQAPQVTNPYSTSDFSSVSSGTYNPALGENGKVDIKFEDGYSGTNNFIHTLTVAYFITNNYNVRFNPNGGSGSMSDQNFVYGTAQNLTPNAFTREGYQFVGWTTNEDGTGTSYTNGQSVNNLTTTAGGIVNLYAKWVSLYKVHFDANGGSGSMSDQNFVYGTAQNLTSNGFTKSYTITFDTNGGSCGTASSTADYDFEGWATSSDGEKVYDDGQNVNNLTTTANGVFNLFAKWSSSPSSIELPTPTRSGYTFAGWFNSEEEYVGAAGDSYIPTADITLKAHWGLYTKINNAGFDGIKDKYSFSWDGIHTTFTIASEGQMNYTGAAGTQHMTIPAGNSSISWTLTNTDCNITVTHYKIVFGNPRMTWSGTKFTVDGDEKSMGTWATNFNVEKSDIAKGNDASININASEYIDIYSIELWYTITPNAPTASETDLDATLNLEDKQKVAVSSLFSMTDPAADFVYAYRLKEDYANAHIEDGYFWATEGGDYEVQACVASGEDHEASAWSTATIHVTKTCIFNGTSSTDWQTTGNWAHSATPTASDAVRVLGNVTVDEEIEMLSLSIEGEAIVEVTPTGGLKVGRGGITGAMASNLILKAGVADDVKGKTGYLRISPTCEAAMPNAKVEIFTKSFNGVVGDGAKSYTEWQYVGSPLVGGEKAKPIFNSSYIYNWNESEGQWENNRKTLELQPFTGYATTQYQNVAGMTITYEGTLCPNTTRVIPLSYTAESAYPGCNMLANSYVAPIDITKMIDADFSEGVEATIYLFNTGSTDHVDGEAGQYISIPINNAGKGGLPSVIPALQGFLVKTTQAGSSLTLNYERVVWSSTLAIQPLRVQTKKDNESTDRSLNVTISTDNGSDKLYLFESENYSKEFENGYDAHKMMGGACNIFTLEGDEQLSVDATNSIIGTRIGVRSGDETAYTLGFSHLETEDDLALWDNETAQAIDIIEGATYTFFAEPNVTINDRFVIIERQAPTITTGVDNTDNNAKVQKFIKDNQMYILKNGRLYNAMGTVVR